MRKRAPPADRRGRLKVRKPLRLYLITTAELYPTKIGYTDNLGHRLGGLQTGHWIELGIYATLVCADVITFEREVHHDLRSRRIRGEWFDIRADEAMKVVLRLFDQRVPGALPFVSGFRRPMVSLVESRALPLFDALI